MDIFGLLRFLKEQCELQEDLRDLRAAREEVKSSGTISWELLKADVVDIQGDRPYFP